MKDLEQNFVPNLLQHHKMVGEVQYTKREHAKHLLKTRFFPVTCITTVVTLTFIVAPILKVVRNLFQTFHLRVDS